MVQGERVNSGEVVGVVLLSILSRACVVRGVVLLYLCCAVLMIIWMVIDETLGPSLGKVNNVTFRFVHWITMSEMKFSIRTLLLTSMDVSILIYNPLRRKR